MKLAFSGQPTTGVVGAAITPAIQVTVQDAQGATVTGSTASITLAITSGSGTSGAVVSGTLTQAAVNGVATFANLTVDKVGTGYTLTATATSLTSATSSAFAVNPGAAAKLAFTVQPSTVAAGAAVSPAVQVTVQDALGNTVTSSTASITLAITSGTGTTGAVLGGTRTVAAVSGVATFASLTVDKAGTGYSLTAAATSLTSATSGVFVVNPVAVVTVTPSSGPLTGGTALTITGTNFPATVDSVRVGTGRLGSLVRVSSTQLTGTTPTSGTTGAVDVTVYTTVAGNGTCTGCFTYNPALTVSSVSPNTGLLAGGTAVTITGTNFPTTVDSVRVGTGRLGSLVRLSATQLTGVTPARSTAGAVDVTIYTSSAGTAICANCFTYTLSRVAADYYMPLRVGSYSTLHTTGTMGSGWGDRTTSFAIEGTDSLSGQQYYREKGSDVIDQSHESKVFHVFWLRKDSAGNVVLGAYSTSGSSNISTATVITASMLTNFFPNEFLTQGYSRTYVFEGTRGDSVLSVTETVSVPAGTFANCLKISGTVYDSNGTAILREYAYYAYGIGLVKIERTLPESQANTAVLMGYGAAAVTSLLRGTKAP